VRTRQNHGRTVLEHATTEMRFKNFVIIWNYYYFFNQRAAGTGARNIISRASWLILKASQHGCREADAVWHSEWTPITG